MKTVTILGAGMAGFGASHRLRELGASSVTFDKNAYYGGHTMSFRHEPGFIFDDGPHVSFTKDEGMQRFFAAAIDDQYEVIQAKVNNHWRGHWIKHPAQCNLHGLPVSLVTDILDDFVLADRHEPGPIANYEEWLIASFGETFARTFPMEYTKKYHTTSAANMSTDWLGPRLYRPQRKEVFRGALTPSTEDVHYVSHFRYPSNGGFISYLNQLPELTELRLGCEVTAIDPRGRQITLADGATAEYRSLVSSLPLPRLIPLITGAPRDVVEAAGELAWTTCVVVNVGIDRADISPAHWTYFYDDDYFLTRLSFPHMLSLNNVPPGAGAIQAEVYYSHRYRPIDRKIGDCIQPVIADLRRCGLIRQDDRILFQNAVEVEFANVIFDLARTDALSTVHGYLDDVEVAYCGRYGEWGYHWTDESFRSGEKAAERAFEWLAR